MFNFSRFFGSAAAKGAAATVGVGAGVAGIGAHYAAGSHYFFDPVKGLGAGAISDGEWNALMLNSQTKTVAGNSNVPDYDTWSKDPDFMLGSYRCARAFFPGADLPDRHTIVRYSKSNPSHSAHLDAAHSSAGDREHANLKPLPSGVAAGEEMGLHMSCNLTSLNTRGKQFLLRSETAFRNLKVGMVFWMAAKTVHHSWGSGAEPYVYIMSFLAFLEKVEDGTDSRDERWEVKGGYGWREIVAPAAAKTLVVKTPMETEPLFSYANARPEDPSAERFRAGIWREMPDKALNTEYGLGLSESAHVHGNNQLHPIVTHTPRGFTGADVFHYPEGEYSWKRFENRKVGGMYHITLNAKDTIED